LIRPEQHFTQPPPPRFSEASLVKELEERGIGRPSTYASIMSTIVDRGYVEKREARFLPDRARHPGQRPASSRASRRSSTRSSPPRWSRTSTRSRRARSTGARCSAGSTRRFKDELEKAAPPRCATSSARRSRTEWVCEKCGKPMVIKWGPQTGRSSPARAIPSAANTQEVVKKPRRHVGQGPAADHRRGVRDLRRADDDQARPVRLLPGVHALSPTARPPSRSRSA